MNKSWFTIDFVCFQFYRVRFNYFALFTRRAFQVPSSTPSLRRFLVVPFPWFGGAKRRPVRVTVSVLLRTNSVPQPLPTVQISLWVSHIMSRSRVDFSINNVREV